MNINLVKDRLDRTNGKEYWRSLEEFSRTGEFEEWLKEEFPQHVAVWSESFDRRRFLQLIGASLAISGLGACTRQPAESITPYIRQPEGMVPGNPLFYATAMTLGGFASGILVESHEGRPTKVEGNPDHPSSLGATDLFAQASILDLYDPDRSQTLTYRGAIRPYSDFLNAIRSVVVEQLPSRGAGVRFLTETVTSPTLADQFRHIQVQFPESRWHQFEPLARDNSLAGARRAFGESVQTVYSFDQADVVVALDSDFLSMGPGCVRYIHDFVKTRRLGEGNRMSRLYSVESTLTLTGAKADHRLAVRPSEVEAFALELARALNVPLKEAVVPTAGPQEAWLRALAVDLLEHRGSSIVIPGEHQSVETHVLCHAMNALLGNVGRTVRYTDPATADPVLQSESLEELLTDMDDGRVGVLVILGGNPVYNAPADSEFLRHLERVPLRIHLSPYNDETSEYCHWHVPEAHYLEAWGDARAFDGTVSIVQPLISPLYRGKSIYEVLAAFSDRPERPGYEIVRDYWRARWGSMKGDDFERAWRNALHDGLIAGSELPEKSVSFRYDALSQVAPKNAAVVPERPALEFVYRADSTVYDGRFANNAWLQELPKSITKLTWDNAVLMSPATAKELGIELVVGSAGGEHGETLTDLVELIHNGRTVEAPVWIQPGHSDACVTILLGYGRTRSGKVGSRTGFNAYTIRTKSAQWIGTGLEVRRTGRRYPMANTQGHWNMEGRDIIRAGTLAEYQTHASLAPHGTHEFSSELTLYPDHPYTGYSWGMAIDLNACIGCNACVVACQAENNIPVVGKEQVALGREMHWLRVDRYHKGDPEDAGSLRTFFQPVPCMHCENAPCELVCPVAATVHSAEGLNDMIYNRCVGTRYCSNNCPYKVRRFNFLLYQDWESPSLKPLRNPEVTVRSRGVMEKCTYCVQRINRAKITSERENRKIADGEIQTACQGVCPAQAIVFGDINDPNSKVSRLKAEERNYGLLAHLNTRPRTTYLGSVQNVNQGIQVPETGERH